jgi:hypothetical protein
VSEQAGFANDVRAILAADASCCYLFPGPLDGLALKIWPPMAGQTFSTMLMLVHFSRRSRVSARIRAASSRSLEPGVAGRHSRGRD